VACLTSINRIYIRSNSVFSRFIFSASSSSSLLFTNSHYLTVKQPTITSSTYKSRALIVIFRVHTVFFCHAGVYNLNARHWRRRRRERMTAHTHIHRVRKGKHISGHSDRMSVYCWPLPHHSDKVKYIKYLFWIQSNFLSHSLICLTVPIFKFSRLNKTVCCVIVFPFFLFPHIDARSNTHTHTSSSACFFYKQIYIFYRETHHIFRVVTHNNNQTGR